MFGKDYDKEEFKEYPKGFFTYNRSLTPLSMSWVSNKEIREWINRNSINILRGKTEEGDELGKVSSIASGDTRVLIIDWGEEDYEIIVSKGYKSKSVYINYLKECCKLNKEVKKYEKNKLRKVSKTI